MINTLPKGPKILIVDDNPIIQRSLYFILRDAGYQPAFTGTIAEAFNHVRNEKFDLILLDINFQADADPCGSVCRDGFSALEWMRRMDEVKNVPIVIISSDDPKTASPRAQAAGSNGYLHKPIDKDLLKLTIAELLLQKTQSTLPTPQRLTA